MKDNGYDVTDYHRIDQRLGDFGEFAEFVDTAEEYGIRILVDMVFNHTSDQHFWYQEARKDKKQSIEIIISGIETKHRQVLAHCCGTENGTVIGVHNFSDQR